MTTDHIDDALTGETVELLRAMIRNRCVNDGTAQSGDEIRNVELLESFLAGPGVEFQTWEPLPGRSSLVARIEGIDPEAPSVCLMGHTDVVPASIDGWDRDPFAAEIHDGEVWGRGAVDMLNLTSSMAVAFRHIARTGQRPQGDLIYFAVADEEAGGRHGAGWFTENDYDPIRADYVLTESGGTPIGSGGDDVRRVTVTVAEKGIAWRRLTVRGTPGHGSMPFGADNAVIKAAEVIRRLAEYRPGSVLSDTWTGQVEAMGFEGQLKQALLDPGHVWEAIGGLENPATAKRLHACTHTTFSPNIIKGGSKTNTIPDEVVIDVDIRTVPGENAVEVEQHLRNALGDMFDTVEVRSINDDPSTASSTETPMWDTLTQLTRRSYPEAVLVPTMTTGGTDSRFYRAKGAECYGAGLFSTRCRYEDFASRFHGRNERVDIDSLALTTALWLGVVEQFWDVASS
ncbi:MAG: M20/M25/M40 family metallo-hydrolase [Actinomycetia bacterium]|nr:M20/M25/M40 family metallo-hydrolase [Actinomycetes bacterium]MCP4959356.1 M20/M25/M40 family metallo-hydrolase [Actinomycetes bacterium]